MTLDEYKPSQDYCKDAKNWQSVPNAEDVENYLISKNKPHESQDIYAERLGTLYSCPDNYRMGSIQDNQVYIATTDQQHDIIASGGKFKDHEDKVSGPSGYFSDQETVDTCKTGEALDNTKYNEMCQIAPYREGGLSSQGDAVYKPHVDCFKIDRDALYENYKTYDFNAAIAKCNANNHFGSGGGNQGYNPYLSEMIDNGTLKYVPEKSYSDPLISKSEHNNPNVLTNSIVDKEDYRDMMRNAQTRAQDCVNHNTPHPSYEARNNGFPPNPHPIKSNTGHATPVQQANFETCGATKNDLPPIRPIQTSAESAAGPDDISTINQGVFEVGKATSNVVETGQTAAKSITEGMV